LIQPAFARWGMKAIFLAGLLMYTGLAWGYADSQSSVLDEGAYLLKGYYFVDGKYEPYQDGGPITNHMPLSFLVPGAVQAVFGPGIRPARIFSVVLGAVFIVLLWVGVRRVAGERWAAGAVWITALNPALIKMYSIGTSQVLVAVMLMGILALSLGEKRPPWQLNLAAVLAGLLLMTRINLSPVLPLLLVYIYWEHGRRAGLSTAIYGFLAVLLLHLVFLPGILRIWAHWLPEALTPFLDPFRIPEATPFWDPEPDLTSRIISFFHGLRFHFVFLMGLCFAWLLALRPSGSSTGSGRKGFLFVSAVFLVLLLAHAWAALVLNYCVFCFPVYLSFFSFVGILAVVMSIGRWSAPDSRWKELAGFALFILVCTGMAFSAFDLLGEGLMTIELPRVKDFRFQPGTVELWGLLNNRFGWSYPFLERALPAVAGLLAGVAITGGFVIYRWFARRRKGGDAAIPFRQFAFGILLAGIVLSPSPLLGGGYSTYDCAPGVIASYERVGNALRARIPTGSAVYWQGTLSAVPLLYLEGVEIFPSQINLDYTFRLDGDGDELVRFGLWNEDLARGWIRESDYLIVSDRHLEGWLAEAVAADPGLTRVLTTEPAESCDPETVLNLYRRGD
jgi:hypothetical protein